MTMSATAAPAAVTELADGFVRLMRTFNRARDQYHADDNDLEWHQAIVLKSIHQLGPLRLGRLADHLRLDPSTLSRHVSTLVKDGFVERVADQEDGRASVLRVTPKADPVLAEIEARRVEFFASVVTDWSEADIRDFVGSLSRFESDFRRRLEQLSPAPTPSSPNSSQTEAASAAAPEEN